MVTPGKLPAERQIMAALREAQECLALVAADWEGTRGPLRLRLHRCERRLAKLLARFPEPSPRRRR